MNEDADLLRRYVQEGSEAAFSELVGRRIGLVYAIAWRRTHDAHRAQDVAQAVFTALARKAPQLTEHQTLVGWLYRSAHFAASDAVRAARRQQRHEEEAMTMQSSDNPTSEPVWHQLSPVVDEVLSEMSVPDRDAVLLRVVDERSYVEIARDLGVGESGARMRVERALEKMRLALARRGITSTAAALTLAIGQQAGAAVPTGLTSVVASSAMTAAAGAGGVSVILTFMSTTKVTITTLGFVALAAVVSSVYEVRTAKRAESAIAQLTAERNQLRSRLGATEAKKGAAPTATTPARGGSLGASASAADQAAPGLAEPEAQRAAWAAPSAINLALETPEGKAAFVRQEVLRADDRFRRLFDELQLSPEQREAMGQQFERYAEAKLDYYEAVRAAGFGPMSPPQDPKVLLDLMRAEEHVDAGFAQGLRGVLGEEGASKFSDYRKTVPAMNVAEQLAGQLYDTGEPLTSTQASALVEVLQQNPYRAGSDTSPGTTLGGESVDLGGAKFLSNLVHGDLMMPGLAWPVTITDAALEHAQAILTPRQFAALRELQARQVESYKLAPPVAKGATQAEALALSRKSQSPN